MASALSRYGTDRVLLISSTARWHNIRVRSHGLHSAADPVVRYNHDLRRHGHSCPQLRLRLLLARREAFQAKSGDLRSQLASSNDVRRGTRKARYLHAVSGGVSVL